jgi:hypothetical protein
MIKEVKYVSVKTLEKRVDYSGLGLLLLLKLKEFINVAFKEMAFGVISTVF